MGSEEGSSTNWSVFDRVKSFPSTPEVVMAEIDTAIAKLEQARATKLLFLQPSSPSSQLKINKGPNATPVAHYDARMADEAYRAGCAALAAGKLDDALQSLNFSLAKCPPDKTSAVAKLQSLISLTSQQLRRSPG